MANKSQTVAPATETNKVNTNLADKFHSVLRWLDANILPLIALPALGALAADDIKTHLVRVTPQVALAIGIAFASLLAVKSHK